MAINVGSRALPICVAIFFNAASGAWADECRVGFDLGSSGVRVGTSLNSESARTSIDFLADVWADGKIDTTLEAAIESLKILPRQAGIPSGCQPVAGGYSAWRMAVEKSGGAAMSETIKTIWRRTGVPVFIIPQDVEGSYGYFAAKLVLGDKLATPFILDIGGGSMQISNNKGGWGTALGQKAWRRKVCLEVKEQDEKCAPNPLGRVGREKATQALKDVVATAREALGGDIRVTAVSTPVVRGIYPILRYLSETGRIVGKVDQKGFDQAALSSAIDILSTQDDAGILELLDQCQTKDKTGFCKPQFVSTFVTDMLLVNAFMEGMPISYLDVAEADLTNVPGIIADERAYAWSRHFDCYATRLSEQGIMAYFSTPATCPDGLTNLR